MAKKCVWVVSADMGYGHLRAADPFSKIACRRIISINTDNITPEKEQKYWRRILSLYENISRSKRIPVVGNLMFSIMNYLLKIPPATESRDLSKPTFQVKMLNIQIKKGLCKGLTGHLAKHPGTLLTSFYAPAIAADLAGIDDVFCIICDSDLNRVWVAKNPQDSNIKYFSPCQEASLRLERYGVKKERIFTTGFPLHPELVGSRRLELAKRNFTLRMKRLKQFSAMWHGPNQNTQPLNIVFAIGGAGAQSGLAKKLFDELFHLIARGLFKFTVIAGTRVDVKTFFEENKQMMSCENFQLIWAKNHNEYFRAFNLVISQADILISKPSEISFYAGLGIPFLIAPPIGSQEQFNRNWLLKNNAAMELPPSLNGISDWLIRQFETGKLFELAENGFQNIEKDGFYKICDHLAGKILIEN
jgi:hypothetical protein